MCSLEFLDLEAWGKRLLQLLCLLLVFDDQCLQESGATHLELGVVGILFDLDTYSILPSGFQEEVLDLFDFSWHFIVFEKKIYNLFDLSKQMYFPKATVT